MQFKALAQARGRLGEDGVGGWVVLIRDGYGGFLSCVGGLLVVFCVWLWLLLGCVLLVGLVSIGLVLLCL
ncbi:hypothetical protein ACTHT5_11300 [Neisseria sp. P0022.S002]|uniref:hypothetical protein n=1 Tax=Neisseria sp. P0022.S002 TaxID=3436827 RepID=UPI003F7EF210